MIDFHVHVRSLLCFVSQRQRGRANVVQAMLMHIFNGKLDGMKNGME